MSIHVYFTVYIYIYTIVTYIHTLLEFPANYLPKSLFTVPSKWSLCTPKSLQLAGYFCLSPDVAWRKGQVVEHQLGGVTL